MNKRILTISGFLLFFTVDLVDAAHSDLFVDLVSGDLTVLDGPVFEGEFGNDGIPDFTEDPGFNAADGTLTAGDDVGFNVVDALLYWDGSAFTDTVNDENVDITFASLGPVTVTDSSGPQTGFTFAVADSEGGIHTHLNFSLLRPGSTGFPQSPAPAVGAYGLILELTSSQHGTSEPFIVMFNNGLSTMDFEDGVAAAEALLAGPGTVPADRDEDGDVDGVDFATFAACFNKAGNPPRTLGCGPDDQDALDFDDDGDIDGVDFAAFAACFNKAGNPPRTLGCPTE